MRPKLRLRDLLRPSGDHREMISRRTKGLVRVAEAAGFEPARGLTLNPLSRSADPCSPWVATVRDLGERARAMLGELRRTGVNETETETTFAPDAQLVTAAMTPASPRLRLA